jgi:hypothetical protein
VRESIVEDDAAAASASRWSRRATLLLAVLILIPSLWGFGSKFREFLLLVRGEADGTFALTPVVNYLLASLGFLCLFGWAALHGMFHDIERPKRAMLETEARLDAESARQRSERNPR